MREWRRESAISKKRRDPRMTKTALLRLTRAALISATCLCAATVSYAQQQPGMPSEAAPAEDAAPPIDLKADWPCVQGKVDTLTVVQMWDGPSTEGKKGWGQDRQLSTLITILASRRIPEADAEAALKKYADSVPEAERDEKLTLLFAGLFDKVNMERKSVISGIEKYQKAQRARAEELERQTTEIAKLERRHRRTKAPPTSSRSPTRSSPGLSASSRSGSRASRWRASCRP